jgi:hypothetical protein
MCSGSRGFGVRRSITTNDTSRTTLAASAMIVNGADHEWVSALEKP